MASSHNLYVYTMCKRSLTIPWAPTVLSHDDIDISFMYLPETCPHLFFILFYGNGLYANISVAKFFALVNDTTHGAKGSNLLYRHLRKLFLRLGVVF